MAEFVAPRAADIILPIYAAAMHITCHAFHQAATACGRPAVCCPGYLLG